jgi:hypothetical protein
VKKPSSPLFCATISQASAINDVSDHVAVIVTSMFLPAQDWLIAKTAARQMNSNLSLMVYSALRLY